MKAMKLVLLGAFLVPSLVFGLSLNEPERDPVQQQQREQQREMRERQQTERRSSQAGRMQGQQDAQRFITAVSGDAISIDHLIGSSARTADNEEVGNVEDILMGHDGQIKAVVLSVGGFLGMGSKDVALNWNNVSVVPDNGNAARASREQTASRQHKPNEFVVLVDVTEDALRDAPEYDRNW